MTVRDAIALAEAAGLLGVIMAGVYAVQLFSRRGGGGKDRFGLKFTDKDNASETYEGVLEGANVRVYGTGDSWFVTFSIETGSRAEFFAHAPTFALDRPLAALLGTQRLLDTPPAFEKAWKFYGTAPAVLIIPRLPAPTPAWGQLELARGTLRLTLDFNGRLSRKNLEREAAVFRAAFAAVAS